MVHAEMVHSSVLAAYSATRVQVLCVSDAPSVPHHAMPRLYCQQFVQCLLTATVCTASLLAHRKCMHCLAMAGGGETGEELDVSLLRIMLYHEYWQGLLHQLDLDNLRANSAVSAAPDASKRSLAPPQVKSSSPLAPSVVSSASALTPDTEALPNSDVSSSSQYASAESADHAAVSSSASSSSIADSQGAEEQEATGRDITAQQPATSGR